MAGLVSTSWLAEHLNDPDLVIADVRWVAAPPPTGAETFRAAHIPGAVYLDLDTDLSDRTDLRRGRHPLPDPQVFVKTLARAGIGERTHLIVYDDQAGSLAARLWWMMKWIGAPEAGLLDGGFAQWQREARPVESGPQRLIEPARDPIAPRVNRSLTADTDELEILRTGTLLLDARAPERYCGDVEPIDARGGHIAGAVNAPWRENLTGDVFKSREELRSRFETLGISLQTRIISSCGSGVTACHNLFALERAGYFGARLYPGSWSEWIVLHP